MRSVKVMLDETKYTEKPVKSVGIIQNKLKPVTIEVDRLADLLCNGCSFRPAVLSGRTKDSWISQCVYGLDFDDGTKIEDFMCKCNEVNILPTFVYTTFSHTEAKHKFRAVFVASRETTDINERNTIQQILMSIFEDSDGVTFNPDRIFFGGKGKIPYYIEDNVLDVERILKNEWNFILKNDTICMTKIITESLYSNDYIGQYKPQDYKTNIDLIREFTDESAKELARRINLPHIIAENIADFYNYIYSIDMNIVLNIPNPKNFCCLFHNDTTPSANIFFGKDGISLYHCFGECNKTWNIIGVIEKLSHSKNRVKTLKFVETIFNVEISENEWQLTQKRILDENIRVLRDSEYLKQNYPKMYSIIERNKMQLINMCLIAKDNVYSEKLTDSDGNVVFFASLDYIAKQLGKSSANLRRIGSRNVLFMYLGLLNKLSEEDIPDYIKDGQKEIRKNKNTGGNKNHKDVTVYSIPSYVEDLLEYSECKANDWRNHGYTMTGNTREMFYRAEGEEVANKLFPQYKEITVNGKVEKRKPTKESTEHTEYILKAVELIVNSQGYATEKDIISVVDEKYKRSATEKQIKRSIGCIISEESRYTRVRCNKYLKEKYHITSNGFPFIIVEK